MDKDKLAKLSEMSMSRYLAGGSRISGTTLKLKPKLKCARYFLFSSDLKNAPEKNDELLFVSEAESKRVVAVEKGPKKVVVKELTRDIRPLGMAVVDHGTTLAVIDAGTSGVASLKYYSRKDDGKLTLRECMTKTSDGNLSSCLLENNLVKYPENVCKEWEPKDVVETRAGDLVISEVSDRDNRLWKYSLDGRLVASFGRSHGPGESTFKNPLHITTDAFGRILASDWENRNVLVFDGRGMWLNVIGSDSGSDRKNRCGLGRPGGLSCDSLGNVFVCDVSRSRLAMYSGSGSFIENIFSNKNCSPSAVRINNETRIMAVSYADKKNAFKKFTWGGLPMTYE